MFLLQEGDSGSPFEALFYACYIAKEVLEAKENGLERQVIIKAERWCRSALALTERMVSTRVIVRYNRLV
jgi:hypothetical protein